MAIVLPPRSSAQALVRTTERGASIAGLNRNVSIQALGEKGHAQVLDNWICRTDGLHVRNGWRKTATGANGSPIRSLLTYKSAVFARQDDEWIGSEIKNAGGVHLIATGANGGFDPIWFDGRYWQTPDITGVNPRSLRGVCRHGERLFFFEAGTLCVRYLGLDHIAGPTEPLRLDMLFRKGGAIAAIGSTTSDGGIGGNDQFVVVTTMGEVAVYQGENPETPAAWQLLGVFETAKPVGSRCLFRMGSGLGLLTDKGLISVPAMLAADASEREAAAISDAVDPVGMTSGLTSEHGAFLLVHTATGASGGFQWVQDPQTKGWSRLTGLGATCWAETPSGLYFGRVDGSVARYEGWADNPTQVPGSGDPISTVMVEGFSKYAAAGVKQFSRVRPIWTVAQPYRARMELLTDYQAVPTTTLAAYESSPDLSWNELRSIHVPIPLKHPVTSRLGAWRGVSGRGTVAALIMGAKFHGHPAIYHGHDVEMQAGGHRR